MKIEFGAGLRPKEGFVACDVRQLDTIKYVCNCWEIDMHVDKDSVEEIYSRHMFEHLTFAQGKMALTSWFKILKSGGKVHLVMPNLEYHIRGYLDYYNKREGEVGKKHNFSHQIAGIFGWQKETQKSDRFTTVENLWDVHKSGYDEISLRGLVESHGYVNFTRHKNDPWHLDVTFFKEE